MAIRQLLVFAAVAAAVAAQPQGAKPPAVQMPGDNGKVGVPYSMGKAGDELVFTLEKAEFAVRAITHDNGIFAYENQRLLIVTYAVQNPAKADRQFHGSSFKFTVVSPDDQNYVAPQYAYHPDKLDWMQLNLKPAQKVRAWFAVQIHPRGVVNKLIVQRGEGTKVLRYDLRDKVKPFIGPWAAENKVDILEIGKAKPATVIPMGWFDINVEKVEEIAESPGFKAEEGNKLVVATITIKNVSKWKPAFGDGFITTKLYDENGEEGQFLAFAKMSGLDKPAHGNMEPDQQMRVRYVFEVPTAMKPTYIRLWEASSGRSVDILLN
jgi:hypothetical protein